MRQPRGPVTVIACAMLSAALTLTSCGGTDAPSSLDRLPEGVSITIYQSRLDASERKYEISVTNYTGTDLTVTGLELSSPALTEPMVYERLPTTISPGRTIDFRVPLAATDCDATSTTPSVAIEFEHADTHGAATIEPHDRYDQLAAITLQDCLASDAAGIARLSFSDTLQRATVTGREVAILSLSIEPTGTVGEMTLHTIGDTPLLALLDPATGTAAGTLQLGVTVAGTDAPTTLEVAVMHSRCDQHSVADDKRGTHFPIEVSTPRREGTLTVATSERTRSELFRYLADVCDWG